MHLNLVRHNMASNAEPRYCADHQACHRYPDTNLAYLLTGGSSYPIHVMPVHVCCVPLVGLMR